MDAEEDASPEARTAGPLERSNGGNMHLPPCGIYRTTAAIGPIQPGRLVFFHNHGDPGPGVYPPESWHLNRAVFAHRGVTLPDSSLADTLEPLQPEGLYRVTEAFTCCERECVTFNTELLVQLGYNGNAQPILFVPNWTKSGLAFPETGHPLRSEQLRNLQRLRVEGLPEPSAHLQ